MNLASFIRDIHDFPHKGVVYKDITPLLQNNVAFRATVDSFVAHYRDQHIDLVLGIEARGFLLAAAIAYAINSGLVIARKPGKLPFDVLVSDGYTTEYSKDTLHIHKDAITKGQNVLIIDDVLATGGTANAAHQLVEKLGGVVVGFGFLLELAFIDGRKNLAKSPVHSLLVFQ